MGLEEARTQAHDSTEWEEGSKEGILGCQSPMVEAERQSPELELKLAEPWVEPLPGPVLDSAGVMHFHMDPSHRGKIIPNWPVEMGWG